MRKTLLIPVLVALMSFAATLAVGAVAQTPADETQGSVVGEETTTEETNGEETTTTEQTTTEEITTGETSGEETTEETSGEEITSGGAASGEKPKRERRERREKRQKDPGEQTEDSATGAPGNNGNGEGGGTAEGGGGVWRGVTGSVGDALGNVSRGRLPNTGGGWTALLLIGAVLISGGWLLVRRFSSSR
jgi:LPXTG-motif cell wall-anchored protein